MILGRGFIPTCLLLRLLLEPDEMPLLTATTSSFELTDDSPLVLNRSWSFFSLGRIFYFSIELFSEWKKLDSNFGFSTTATIGGLPYSDDKRCDDITAESLRLATFLELLQELSEAAEPSFLVCT